MTVALIIGHLALASVGAAAVIVSGLIVRRIAGRDTVLRYRLLVAFLVALIALPAVQMLGAAWLPGARLPASMVVVLPRLASAPAPPAAGPPAAEASSSDAVRPAAVRSPSPLSLVLIAWLVGVGIAVGVAAARVRKALAVLRHCRPASEPRLERAWNAALAAAPPRRAVRLLECEGLPTPACWGWRRPAVVVPARAAASMSEEHLRCALHHELIHLRRLDPLVAVAQITLTAAFWFHPLVWLFARALDRDREYSCDALVVRATRRPRAYALALLEHCDRRRAAVPSAVPQFGSASTVRRRLEMIRSSSRIRPRPARGRCLAAGALIAAAGVLAGHATLAAGLAGAAPPRVEPGPMKAIIRAHPDGRTEVDVWRKWLAYAEHYGGWLADIQPGMSVTEQESVVSADGARLRERRDGASGRVLRADRMLLNLPEGSKLSAVILGDEVSMMPAETETHITVRGGEVRIVDQAGVVRVVARAGVADGVLRMSTALDRDEVAFGMTATGPDGRPVPVQAVMDLETGIPPGDDQPRHGAERWQLFTPDEPGPGTYVLKMQWVYDAWEMKTRHGDR